MTLTTARRAQAQSTSYWRSLSESQLLEIQFTTSEPELLEGMSAAPPPPGEARVEFAYNLKGRAAGKAVCVHCGFANHFRGFVIIHADGSRRMVGKDCGRKIYGAHFDLLEKDFDAARDLAGYLRRKNAMLTAEAPFLEGLAELIAHSAVKQFQEIRRSLRDFFPTSLFADLAAIANSGAQLSVEERIRDIGAELRRTTDEDQYAEQMKGMNKRERREFRKEHGIKGGEIYTTVNRSLGALMGPTLFLALPAPMTALVGLQRDFSNAFSGLKVAKRNARQLGEAQKRLIDLIDLVKAEIGRLQAPINFFELGHLSRFSQWVGLHDTGAIYTSGIGWIERRDENGEKRASFPSGYVMPDTRFVDLFRVGSAVQQI